MIYLYIDIVQIFCCPIDAASGCDLFVPTAYLPYMIAGEWRKLRFCAIPLQIIVSPMPIWAKMLLMSLLMQADSKTLHSRRNWRGRAGQENNQISLFSENSAWPTKEESTIRNEKTEEKTSKSKPDSTKTFKGLVQEYSTDPPVNFHGVYDYSYPLPHWNMPNTAQMTSNFNSLAEINGPFMNHFHDKPIYHNL